MKFKRIAIKNWRGLPDLEFFPKTFCVISGANAEGKSSAIEAIRAVGDHMHDPDCIRNGSDFAEVVIEPDNGHSYRMRTTKTATTWDFKDEKGRKITRSAEHIASIINIMSMDPVRFLKEKPDEQVKIYLSMSPLRVTAEDLAFVPPKALEGINLDAHALEVIGDKSSGITKYLYEERTIANRIAKEKRASASEMRKSLPEESPNGDWGELSRKYATELRDLQIVNTARISTVDSDTKSASDAVKELFQAKRDAIKEDLDETTERRRKDLEAAISKLRAEFDDGVSRMRADSDIEVKRCEGIRDSELARIEASQKAVTAEIETEFRPKLDDLTAKIAQANEKATAHAQAETARKYIRGQEKEADEQEAASRKLTKAIDQLDALKLKKMSEAPIPGLIPTPKGLVYNDVPLRILNKAEQLTIALEIAMLRAGECPVIILDDLEHFSSDNYADLRKTCLKFAAERGGQFIGGKVTDTKLLVVNE
jgi:hypothetical protein